MDKQKDKELNKKKAEAAIKSKERYASMSNEKKAYYQKKKREYQRNRIANMSQSEKLAYYQRHKKYSERYRENLSQEKKLEFQIRERKRRKERLVKKKSRVGLEPHFTSEKQKFQFEQHQQKLKTKLIDHIHEMFEERKIEKAKRKNANLKIKQQRYEKLQKNRLTQTASSETSLAQFESDNVANISHSDGQSKTSFFDSKKLKVNEFKASDNKQIITILAKQTTNAITQIKTLSDSSQAEFKPFLQAIAKDYVVGSAIIIGVKSVNVAEKLSTILQTAEIAHEISNPKNKAIEMDSNVESNSAPITTPAHSIEKKSTVNIAAKQVTKTPKTQSLTVSDLSAAITISESQPASTVSTPNSFVVARWLQTHESNQNNSNNHSKIKQTIETLIDSDLPVAGTSSGFRYANDPNASATFLLSQRLDLSDSNSSNSTILLDSEENEEVLIMPSLQPANQSSKAATNAADKVTETIMSAAKSKQKSSVTNDEKAIQITKKNDISILQKEISQELKKTEISILNKLMSYFQTSATEMHQTKNALATTEAELIKKIIDLQKTKDKLKQANKESNEAKTQLIEAEKVLKDKEMALKTNEIKLSEKQLELCETEAKLKVKIDELKVTKNNLNQVTSFFNKHWKKQKAQKQQLKKSLEGLEQKLKSSTSTLSQVSLDLEQAKMENIKTNDLLKTIKAELATKQTEVQTINNTLSQVSDDLEQAKATIERKENQIKTVANKFEILKKSNQKLTYEKIYQAAIQSKLQGNDFKLYFDQLNQAEQMLLIEATISLNNQSCDRVIQTEIDILKQQLNEHENTDTLQQDASSVKARQLVLNHSPITVPSQRTSVIKYVAKPTEKPECNFLQCSHKTPRDLNQSRIIGIGQGKQAVVQHQFFSSNQITKATSKKKTTEPCQNLRNNIETSTHGFIAS